MVAGVVPTVCRARINPLVPACLGGLSGVDIVGALVGRDWRDRGSVEHLERLNSYLMGHVDIRPIHGAAVFLASRVSVDQELAGV